MIKRFSQSWPVITLFFLVILLLLGSGKNRYPGTGNPTPTIDPLANWKIYRDEKERFQFKYPPEWISQGTFFTESKTKVAEFSPGMVTLNEKISCQEYFHQVSRGEEINLVESGEVLPATKLAGVLRTENLKIGELDWNLVLTGRREVEEETVIVKPGYSFNYCTKDDLRLFLVTFYSADYPSSQLELFQKVLASFSFII